ncbi:BrnA antitoxin family protein [Phyllobacterium sp. SB3]|uniref:BrnA antitoxin family protein n=1 Tax=Phyllobacterium sp. SB3 TaxID=3156073 RepID=UPI0032AF48EE
MTAKQNIQREFKEGRGYSQKDWDEVSDNPEWTEEDIKNARPFREVFPELAEKIREEIAKRGRPHSAITKQPVTIRLDPDVIAKFKATGRGWQSRINEVLRQAKV